MAQKANHRISTVYSIVASFLLSILGGHAQAKDAIRTDIRPAGQWNAPVPEIQVPLQIRTSGQWNAPVPSNQIYSQIRTSGQWNAPVPNNQGAANVRPAGQWNAPAPLMMEDASFVSVQKIDNNEEMRQFVNEQAVISGINPEQIPMEQFNNLRIQYLLNKVEKLEGKTDQSR